MHSREISGSINTSQLLHMANSGLKRSRHEPNSFLDNEKLMKRLSFLQDYKRSDLNIDVLPESNIWAVDRSQNLRVQPGS